MNIYKTTVNRILPEFSEKCGRGKCKHPICACGHCQRNYHVGKVGECTKINSALATCRCKQFEKKVEQQFVRTYHDEDCPKCGFPETIDVRDAKTMAVIKRECSKGCGWELFFAGIEPF